MELIKLMIVCCHLVTPSVRCYDFNRLFNAPLMDIPYIAPYETAVCGQRFYRWPVVIEYSEDCFKNSYGVKYWVHELRNQSDKPKPQSRIPIYDEWGPSMDEYENQTPNEAPWSVRLVIEYSVVGKRWDERSQTICSGVLISLKHIMTAKYCFTSYLETILIFVNPPSGYDEDYFVGEPGELFWHPHEDLAIAELRKRIHPQFMGRQNNKSRTTINPICLPKPSDEFHKGIKPATYYGWGQIGPGQEAHVLQKADIEVMYDDFTNEKSHNFLQRGIESNYPCQGDAGSGLVQFVDEQRSRAVLIGILKGDDHLPKYYDCNSVVRTWGIFFTRVDKNMDWVLQVLSKQKP